MMIDGTGIIMGIMKIAFLSFIVVPVVPALLTAWACSRVMVRISPRQVMISGVVVGMIAAIVWFGSATVWLVYAPGPGVVWVDGAPPFPCLVTAFISSVATFVLCYWWNSRQINPASQPPGDLSADR